MNNTRCETARTALVRQNKRGSREHPCVNRRRFSVFSQNRQGNVSYLSQVHCFSIKWFHICCMQKRFHSTRCFTKAWKRKNSCGDKERNLVHILHGSALIRSRTRHYRGGNEVKGIEPTKHEEVAGTFIWNSEEKQDSISETGLEEEVVKERRSCERA